MKKIFFMVLATAFFELASVSLTEARDGAYLAIRGGGINENLNSEDDSAWDSNRLDFDNVWFMSGAVGYRWRYLRAELEYTYRDDFDDKIPLAENNPGLPADKYYSHYTLKSKSIMANAYLDLMPNYVVSPYISGGLGLTMLEFEETSYSNGTVQPSQSYDETNFTWSIGAGLSIRLNKCINIDAGYRYIDMGEIEHANINAHEVYGGIRYTF